MRNRIYTKISKLIYTAEWSSIKYQTEFIFWFFFILTRMYSKPRPMWIEFRSFCKLFSSKKRHGVSVSLSFTETSSFLLYNTTYGFQHGVKFLFYFHKNILTLRCISWSFVLSSSNPSDSVFFLYVVIQVIVCLL